MQKLFIYIYLLISIQVAAQSFKFVSYTTKDGLSNNYVENVVQDKTGYLWVATRVGLNRFNGTEFKQYFTYPNDSTSLPFNNVLSLFVDNDNILWLGGYGSMIASFDNTTQIFTLHPIENTPNSHDLDISAIFSNNKNEICISTGNGVFVLRQGIFVHDSTQIPQSNVQTKIIAANGTQWLASQKGIIFIKQSGESVLFNTDNTPEIKSNSIKLIFKDRDNNVWFGTHSGGLIKHSLTAENLQFYSSQNIQIKNNISTGFCADLNNKLFIASDGGGVSVIENNKVVKHIDISSPNSTNSVLDILIDEKNTLWMASWNTGVFSMNDKTQKLQSYSNNFLDNGIANNVKTIATLGDTLFCGTYSDGLVLLNKNNGSIRAYNSSPHSAFLKTPAYINDILAASDETIWVASTRGLFRYKDGVLSQYLLDTSASYKSEKLMVWALNEGSNGTVYAATAYKAYAINKQTDRATELELGITPPYDVKMILEDSKKRIWLGVHDNLFVCKPDGSVSSMKLTQSDFPIDIFNADAIYQAPDEYMYIGTQEGYYSFIPDSLNFNQKAPEIILETFKLKSIAQIPGKSSIIKKHINQVETIVLNHNDFPISFTFSAINFNHQTAIKYAYMLEGIDSKWTTLNGKNELTFHSLQPGTYRLKLKYKFVWYME
ncbi:MAG: hypothetical protein IPO21_05025 [Bacteroidales bacterium]|nr:hypothetical protein [Bacteroidales bacterium]